MRLRFAIHLLVAPRSLVALWLLAALGMASPVLPGEIRREMRLHDVGGLFLVEEEFEAPDLALDEVAGGDGLIYIGEDEEERESAVRLDPEALAATIQELISEDSWTNTRNRLEIVGRRMLVVQTPEVLGAIGDLLHRLERRTNETWPLELAMVPLAALEKSAPELLRPGASPWVADEVFDRLVRDAGAKGVVLSTQVRDGQKAEFRPLATERRLVDYEVNQTGVVPVVNPVIDALSEGSRAEATAYLSPDGTWFRVDVSLSFQELEPPRKQRLAYGELELGRREFGGLSTSVALEAGRPILLGFVSPRDPGALDPEGWYPEPLAALLRVGPGAPPPAPERPDGEEPASRASIRFYSVGLLLASTPDFTLWPRFRDSDDEAVVAFREDDGVGAQLERRRAAAFGADRLLKEIRARLSRLRPTAEVRPKLHRAGRWLLVRGDPAVQAAVRAQLEEFARDSHRMVEIDLWQGPVRAEELSRLEAPTALLDPAWLDSLAKRPGIRARIVGRSGAPVSLAVRKFRSYIADLEKVSGGTGFQTIEVGDPVISSSSAGAGWILDTHCDLVPGTSWGQLHVRGLVERPPRLKATSRVRLSDQVTVVEGAAGSGRRAEARPVDEWLEIELPEEDSDQWQHLVTSPLGRPILLNALPDPGKPGSTRALIAVVHPFRIE